jgi:hypothetical protein
MTDDGHTEAPRGPPAKTDIDFTKGNAIPMTTATTSTFPPSKDGATDLLLEIHDGIMASQGVLAVTRSGGSRQALMNRGTG